MDFHHTYQVSLAFASSRFFRPAQAFLVFRPASSPFNLLVAAATPTGPGKEGSVRRGHVLPKE